MCLIQPLFWEILSGFSYVNACCELGIYSSEKHYYTKTKQFFIKASNKKYIRATLLMGAYIVAEGFKTDTVSWYCRSINLGYPDIKVTGKAGDICRALGWKSY